MKIDIRQMKDGRTMPMTARAPQFFAQKTVSATVMVRGPYRTNYAEADADTRRLRGPPT